MAPIHPVAHGTYISTRTWHPYIHPHIDQLPILLKMPLYISCGNEAWCRFGPSRLCRNCGMGCDERALSAELPVFFVWIIWKNILHSRDCSMGCDERAFSEEFCVFGYFWIFFNDQGMIWAGRAWFCRNCACTHMSMCVCMCVCVLACACVYITARTATPYTYVHM